MSIYGASTDAPYEVRAEMAYEQAKRRQSRHWCTECRGVTWGNSPCAIEPEPEDEEEEQGEDE